MNQQTEPETGLEILRYTGCKVGAHLWVNTSAGSAGRQPDPGQSCQCGLVKWRSAEPMKVGKR